MKYEAVALTLALCGGGAWAANSLSIGSVRGPSAEVPVTMSADGDVQGFVLAISYDASLATVSDVITDETATGAAGADFVVSEILPGENGLTLGVVVDSTGQTGSTIPGDPVQEVARIAIAPAVALDCEDELAVPLAFVDDTLNSPTLSNIIVIGGRSIGAPDLALNDGLYTAVGPCDTIALVGGVESCDNLVPAAVLMDNADPVQGFVLSVAHDSAVATLEDIGLGPAALDAGVEFAVPNMTDPRGGTLGVVLDFDPPFAGQVIPPGTDQHIATYLYRQIACQECDADPVLMDVQFVDNVFGTPPLENVLVVAGMSRSPTQVGGVVAFLCAPVGRTTFYAGAKTEGKPGTIECAEGKLGGTATVGFYYTSVPSLGLSGLIQGLSLAVCVDCANAQWIEDSFTIEGTITEALKAEFVNWHTDNDPSDGEACELIVGILHDAVPPFLDQRYPVTPDMDPLEIARIDLLLGEDLACDAEFEVAFCNGIDGAGTVPIQNRASIDNQSVPARLVNGCVQVDGAAEAEFIRGDCNWDELVDIADPAALVSALFINEFEMPCLDACDANDDGRPDLADVVAIFDYLFHFGDAPPDPGPDPTPGVDPTEDRIGCEAGADAACP